MVKKKFPIIIVSLLLILFMYGLYKNVSGRVTGATIATPYIIVTFPKAGKVVGIEVTLALTDRSTVFAVTGYRQAVSQEALKVAQNIGYAKLISPEGRKAFVAALKTAVAGMMGEIEFDCLVTQFDIVQMLAPNPAWTAFASDDDTLYYLDFDSSTSVGQSTKAWFVMDSKEPKFSNGKQYSSILALHEFDCAESMNKTLTQTAYSKTMAQGEAMFELELPGKWQRVEKDTFLYYMYTAACQ